MEDKAKQLSGYFAAQPAVFTTSIRDGNPGLMIDPGIVEGVEQNKAFKKQMLDRHRPAFDVWLRLARLLEEAVVKERNLDSAFARALDLFFIEAFKSHQSLYLLCITGHGEDAATIARRLFEIALQVGYLCSEQAKREERGARFLAHFWHNSKDIIGAVDIPEDRRKWWEEQYNRHRQLLTFNKKGEPATKWFGSSFAQLAATLGFNDTYDTDYRFLSHVAHCSSRGLLLDRIDDIIQIKTDRLVPEILIYGTKYAIWIAASWNEHFALIDTTKLEASRDEAINFNFKSNRGHAEESPMTMHAIKERYLVDEKGNRVGVFLDMDDYRQLLEASEELESIRAYDAAKSSGDEVVPFTQAVAEIERDRS